MFKEQKISKKQKPKPDKSEFKGFFSGRHVNLFQGETTTLISKAFYLILCLCIFFPAATQATEYRQCTRVVDGDTIILDGDEKVRLIGVDTPESVIPNKPFENFGREASAFTKRMVKGKRVRIEYDWQKVDKYGRTLAYVYLADGTFLNAEIIKQGYDFAYTKFPFKFLEEFRQYEKEAREHKVGLWGGGGKAEPKGIEYEKRKSLM